MYGLKTNIRSRSRVGKPPTDATTRQISAQSPSQGVKAKKIGHGGAFVFAIFGKDEVLSSKPQNTSARH